VSPEGRRVVKRMARLLGKVRAATADFAPSDWTDLCEYLEKSPVTWRDIEALQLILEDALKAVPQEASQ